MLTSYKISVKINYKSKARGLYMNLINSLIIEGVVKNEVTLSQTEQGLQFAKVMVAYERFYKTPEGEEKTEENLFEVECYGNTAEVVERITKNKKKIRVVGRLKQNGEKVVIIAEHCEFKI